MRKIADIIRTLSELDKATLMAAFEEQIPSYIEYTAGRFIGVNTDAIPHLQCEQKAGSFREGLVIHAM